MACCEYGCIRCQCERIAEVRAHPQRFRIGQPAVRKYSLVIQYSGGQVQPVERLHSRSWRHPHLLSQPGQLTGGLTTHLITHLDFRCLVQFA